MIKHPTQSGTLEQSMTLVKINSYEVYIVLLRHTSHYKDIETFNGGVLYKKCALTNFKGKHLCHSLSLNKVAACNFIKKKTLLQGFSGEFC